ncbi:MAG: GntR family transcriptional regulator [Aerococcus sp.]|nr:GntR family transcriptional regulator [Aerococcus sp.]
MAIPKYQKIKNILTMRLNAGEFRPGDRFYTESELSDCFHVSSITAIRALNELANEGYLTRIQGKGTFVEQTQLDHNLRVNFSDDLARTEKPQASEIIAISEASDQYYRDKLAMTANQRDYYCVEVIRYFENEPYSFECHYIRPGVLI